MTLQKKQLAAVLFSCLLLSIFSTALAQEIIVEQPTTYLKTLQREGTVLKIPAFSIADSVVSYAETKDYFQVNVTLTKLPKSNIFTFPLETNGLTFYYQPPLDLELDVKKYDFLNATHAIKDGKVAVYRPENVVGSYAVFKSQKASGETGKLYQIYRPLIIDAKGQRVWGNLAVSKSSLSVTVDSAWLAKASYPVVVDPTFGYTSVGASVIYPCNILIGSKYQCGSNGNVTSISLYISNGTAGRYASVAIYSDNAGVPDALLNESDSEEIAVDGWHNFTSFNIPVTSATYFWLAFQVSQLDLAIHCDSGGEDWELWPFSYDVFPDPYPASTPEARLISIYATVTVASSTTYSYDVSLSKAESTVLQGDLVHFTVNVTRNSTALTSFEANLTRDGEMFRENWNSTAFTDVNLNPLSHTYSVSELYDNELSASVNFTVTPLTVVWQAPQGGPNPTTPGSENQTGPTPKPNPWQFTLTPEGQFYLIAFVVVCLVGFVVSMLITYQKPSRKSMRNKARKNSGLGLGGKRKKKESLL